MISWFIGIGQPCSSSEYLIATIVLNFKTMFSRRFNCFTFWISGYLMKWSYKIHRKSIGKILKQIKRWIEVQTRNCRYAHAYTCIYDKNKRSYRNKLIVGFWTERNRISLLQEPKKERLQEQKKSHPFCFLLWPVAIFTFLHVISGRCFLYSWVLTYRTLDFSIPIHSFPQVRAILWKVSNWNCS